MALTSASGLLCLTALLVAGGCASSSGTIRDDVPSNAVEAASAGPVDTAHLVAMERQAMAAYAAGQYERAIPLYQGMVKAMPEEPEYWYRLANALTRTDHPNDAAVAYEQVLVRDPDNARAWHNLGVVRLLQAQASFANGVKSGTAGEPVFDESLRLSTAVFDLTATDASRGSDPPVPASEPGTIE